MSGPRVKPAFCCEATHKAKPSYGEDLATALQAAVADKKAREAKENA